MGDSTTIKIQRKTKAKLDQRRLQHETYDRTIERLLHGPSTNLREQLIAGAKEHAARDRQLANEWETVDAPWPQE
ncbi:MAG TPA: hypothetical protein VGO08_03935 [Burkholderiales bacterium]|jgi:hypothetical protein|nr:hypothetical protein [Burkholderiales bacterium]